MKSNLVVGLAIALSSVGCVQKVHPKKITLSVDMSAIENVNTVTVKGDFTSPPWTEALSLSDADGDQIYEIELARETAQFGMMFKFLKNGEYELEGQPNRELQFRYQPEQLYYNAVFNIPTATIIKKNSL